MMAEYLADVRLGAIVGTYCLGAATALGLVAWIMWRSR